MFNLNETACIDEPTENLNPTLQFPSRYIDVNPREHSLASALLKPPWIKYSHHLPCSQVEYALRGLEGSFFTAVSGRWAKLKHD